MKTISTEVASNWLTRYKNEMTDDEFKLAAKKLLSEYRIYIAECNFVCIKSVYKKTPNVSSTKGVNL